MSRKMPAASFATRAFYRHYLPRYAPAEAAGRRVAMLFTSLRYVFFRWRHHAGLCLHMMLRGDYFPFSRDSELLLYFLLSFSILHLLLSYYI